MTPVAQLWVCLVRGPDALASETGRAGVEARRQLSHTAMDWCQQRLHLQLPNEQHDQHGAPLPHEGWHRSRSHSKLTAAAVCAPFRVGVDVEDIAPRRDELVPRMCTRDELELLGGFSWSNAFRIWTAKEAVLKKQGVGLLELSQCALTAVGDAYTLWVHHRGRDHQVHQVQADSMWAAISHDGPATTSIHWHRLDHTGTAA